MDSKDVQGLLRDIRDAEQHLENLRRKLINLTVETNRTQHGISSETDDLSDAPEQRRWPLSREEYQRYGRQLVMPEIGLSGQRRLGKSSVLVVGLGGLGCPAAKYLAGAGVGRIGLLDGDVVEISNLHRQILHSTARVGIPKVLSAAWSLGESNDAIKIETYAHNLTAQNCLEILSRYDVILDCTDHPTSRYLISDGAVVSGKPLVSASALKTEGQLILLNYPPRQVEHADDLAKGLEEVASGPCYRCIFPNPPPAETIVSCGEGGILGPVVGVMGVLQALEAIKIITKDASHHQDSVQSGMLIFSAYSSPQFRSLRMRPRRTNCAACGNTPTITREALRNGVVDYITFCGVVPPVDLLHVNERLNASDLKDRISSANSRKILIVDVREQSQFALGSLPESINVPYSVLMRQNLNNGSSRGASNVYSDIEAKLSVDSDLIFVCRMGNDSQMIVQKFKETSLAKGGRWIGDLKGGLRSWRHQVEPDFPDF